jgi:integrase/recombinase XerC
MMVDKFLDYLLFERNYSKRTIVSYGEDLKAFESYFRNLDDRLSWESIDSDIIRDWMESMMDKGNTATSINRRLSALRSLYRFALSHHLVEKDPAHKLNGPKKEKPLPYFLKEREMDQLLDEVAWSDRYKDVCARTIILTFYETGMRLSELTGLKEKDVDFHEMQMKVTGKRNKQRIIPFGEELKNTLLSYINVRDKNIVRLSDEVFLDEKGNKMKDAHVRYVVKKWLPKVCTLKKHSPHVLRHSFATSMLNNRAGLESVKQLLGHKSLETTEVYTHTTFEQLKRVYISAHPRA